MKMTQFGKVVRNLRMEYDLSLKDMAATMNISSAYLSAIEYGEKRLSDKLVDAALVYFSRVATKEQVDEVRNAAEQSKDVFTTRGLSLDAKVLVAAFARRLQEGKQPTSDMKNWLESSL
jgi:transcriptional regulator with XRE-family HTH domain